LLDIPIEGYQTVEDFLYNLENTKTIIESLPKEEIYNILSSTDKGKESLNGL